MTRSQKPLTLTLHPPGPSPDDWYLDFEPSFHLERQELRTQANERQFELSWDDATFAVGEARWITIVHGDWHSWGDHDYYIALKLLERREHEIWQKLPWRDLPVGSIIHAWDHSLNPCSRNTSQELLLVTWEELESAWQSRTIDILYEVDARIVRFES